jgi:HD-GYP domain-containing protein (c-di-GMP phosphodiesterase class II)
VLGVINVNNKTTGESFNEDDLAVLSALVERIGGAVERACAHPDSARVVAEAIEAVRSVTRLQRDHLFEIRDGVHLSRATARELNLPESDVDLIGYVASIHDLGMGPLYERVSLPYKLDEDARLEVRQHPEVSVEIIRPLEYLSSVREIILAHHERWDGDGYPRGLTGPDIPIGARILAAVDSYLSMISGRPYREVRTQEEAIEELRREASRQFDPDVVDALLRTLERESAQP